MGSISLNPMVTTGVSNAFVQSTTGYVQGTFLDSPTDRYQLEGGYVSSTQTTPVWGGLPVNLLIPAVGNGNAQGPALVVSSATIDAWVVFNQASAGIITPSSNVPLYASGMSANFLRAGSNARIVLPLKAADVNTLVGADAAHAIYWDTTNLYLTVTVGSNLLVPCQIEFVDNASKTVSYDGTSGFATWSNAGSVAVVRI